MAPLSKTKQTQIQIDEVPRLGRKISALLLKNQFVIRIAKLDDVSLRQFLFLLLLLCVCGCDCVCCLLVCAFNYSHYLTGYHYRYESS